MKEKIELQKFIVGRMDSYIESSQNKGNIYLALNILVLGGVVTIITTIHICNKSGLLCWLLIAISILAIISLLLTLKSINPYLKGSNKKDRSLFFFKDISEAGKEQYLKSVHEADDLNTLNDLSTQTYFLAKGVDGKYKWLCYVGWIIGVEFILLLIWVLKYLIVNN